MGCTKQLMNVKWEHHTWRPRVSLSEVRMGQETNMWGRVVERDYVRCDKDEVCTECGAVRRQKNCICDMERAERCKLRQVWVANSPQETP